MRQVKVDPLAADVYALGFLLWELWFRSPPFDHQPLATVRSAVAKGRRLPMAKGVTPMCLAPPPKALKELIASCWHQDPSARPLAATAKQLFLEMAPALAEAGDAAIAPAASMELTEEGATPTNKARSAQKLAARKAAAVAAADREVHPEKGGGGVVLDGADTAPAVAASGGSRLADRVADQQRSSSGRSPARGGVGVRSGGVSPPQPRVPTAGRGAAAAGGKGAGRGAAAAGGKGAGRGKSGGQGPPGAKRLSAAVGAPLQL
jgi:hypothetical protein